MKLYKKIVVFSGIWLSLFLSGVSNYSGDDSFMAGNTAFAQDETEKGEKEGEQGEESPCPECPECPDPAKVVLRGLEDRKNMINKELIALEQEKKELETFEEQIDGKLEKLKALQEQIKSDMALLDQKKTIREQEKEAAHEAKIQKLVKMYAGMKPKNAAQIVDKMNLEVAREIFLRMREASSSKILSFVDSEKAAKISERLVFKKK